MKSETANTSNREILNRRKLKLFIAAMVIGIFFGTPSPSAAEHKSIKELPTDMAHWSTFWRVLPAEMYAAGEEKGPLAALTWGMIKGTGKLVQSSSKGLWDIVKPLPNADLPLKANRPPGAIISYSF